MGFKGSRRGHLWRRGRVLTAATGGTRLLGEPSAKPVALPLFLGHEDTAG
jgi:hypothetical protein